MQKEDAYTRGEACIVTVRSTGVECRKRTFETSSEYNYFDDGTLPLNGTHKRPVGRLCSARASR
jgi:hypothetical protein